MLADNLARHAQRTAIVDGETRITYAELEKHMHRVAAGLRARQLAPGDAVALWAPNCWQWVVSAVASWWCGFTVVPIPGRGRILDALPILQATRARLLFTGFGSSGGNPRSADAGHLTEIRATLQQNCPDLRAVADFADDTLPAAPGLTDSVAFAGLGCSTAPVPAADVTAESTAVILFTSGSTGRPKGVLRRHQQSLCNRWRISRRRGIGTEDRLLVVSEFSHSMGLSTNLLCSLMSGATLVIAHRRTPAAIARQIMAEDITLLSAPPSLFAGLLRERTGDQPACSNLRLALMAATSIPPALVRELIATGVGVVVSSYGMTECEIITTTDIADSAEVVATTVGKPIAGLDVRITDEGGAALPAEVAGEVWVRGAAVSCHYLGESGRLDSAVDGERWLHTGDVGCFTAEGYLRILGRKKDVMTIHGYTLYPAEIESLLSQSGMLKEVAVMAVSHEVSGDMSVAFIVPADPEVFSLKHLRLWARSNVADYKMPGRFVTLDRLPLNRAGKVDRIALKASLDA